MRPDEIERFFAARVLGNEALAMAVHEKATNRLIGTCAFSQLDADNGSALYHITIGEKDAWGHGYGTEATWLMLRHAFETLGLHRIALYVFEFNERAIRAYRRCGFVVEGRARESIYREGRWWDELAMSVIDRTGGGSATNCARGWATGARRPARPDELHGAAADAARADVRELIGAKGHAVENARAAVDRLDAAFAAGDLQRTPSMDQYLADLMLALEQDEGQKLGGKSAEASRFILRAIDRELDNA